MNRTKTSPDRKRRSPRITIKPVHTDWEKKLHPFFLRTAAHNKKVADLLASTSESDQQEAQHLLHNTPPELLQEAEGIRAEIKDQERNEAFLAIQGIYAFQQGTAVSENQFMMGWLAWNKYSRTLAEILEGHEAGDEKSSRQYLSVQKEFHKWRYGKLDPNTMHFKTDHLHAPVMLMGLDLGIQKLTPGELADCFDKYCTVCNESHDGENLYKLRKRLTKDVERLTLKNKDRNKNG